MSYEAETICNVYCRLARKDGQRLDCLRVHGLLYFTQGHAMSTLGREIIKDDCECWEYGVIFPTVRNTLVPQYGSGPIEEIHDAQKPWRFEPEGQLQDKDRELIELCWAAYRRVSPVELLARQYPTDSPYTILRNRGGDKHHQIIPKAMIRDYFCGLGKRNTADQTHKEAP